MLKKREAFTIVEITMVIAIIGILAVVVAISGGSLKLSGAANKLMFDLRYAQQLAISRGVSCGVSYDPSNNNYFAYIGDTSTIATDPHTGGTLLVDYDVDNEYKGINLISTNFGDLISFDYMGTPYDSGATALSSQGIVALQHGSATQTVTIEPSTGKVKVP